MPGGDASTDVVATSAAGTTRRPAGAWIRRSIDAPRAAELDRLADLARSAPLWGALPDAAPLLGAFPPTRPVAGRSAPLDWRLVRGTPDDTILVRLRDSGGALDSARIVLDANGEAAGAFRVRPARSGWYAWQVESAGAVASAGAWAPPPEPLRVLITAGPGSVEAREVARALERRGATVTLATDLGRGLRLGDAPAGIPPIAALNAFEAVFVLQGLPLSAADIENLRSFVSAGGGALLAGPAAAAFGVIVGPVGTGSAEYFEWRAPAEVEPLARVAIEAALAPLSPPASFHSAASAGDTTLLALGVDGRGRRAALGLLDTWRWALDAGRPESHAAFWTSVAEWLASGVRVSFAMWVEPPTAAPGLPVRVRLARLDTLADRPGQLHVLRADGTQDSVPLAWSGDEGTARFIARDSGLVHVRLPGDSLPAAAHFADPGAGASPHAWAQLAEIARASGGRLAPVDSLDAIVGAPGTRFPLRAALLVLCALIACGDWAARRLRGRA